MQGLEKSSLPRNTKMVALGNRANFEFRAFQVHLPLDSCGLLKIHTCPPQDSS